MFLNIFTPTIIPRLQGINRYFILQGTPSNRRFNIILVTFQMISTMRTYLFILLLFFLIIYHTNILLLLLAFIVYCYGTKLATSFTRIVVTWIYLHNDTRLGILSFRRTDNILTLIRQFIKLFVFTNSL